LLFLVAFTDIKFCCSDHDDRFVNTLLSLMRRGQMDGPVCCSQTSRPRQCVCLVALSNKVIVAFRLVMGLILVSSLIGTECSVLLTCIWEAPTSDPGRDTCYSVVFVTLVHCLSRPYPSQFITE
jgi:hypothetical protein